MVKLYVVIIKLIQDNGIKKVLHKVLVQIKMEQVLIMYHLLILEIQIVS